MRRKILITLLLLAGMPLVLASETPRAEPVRVGVVYDGEWQLLRSLVAAIQEELAVLTAGEFVIEYPEDKQLYGAWDLDSISDQFQQLLNDDSVDIVLTAGLAASQIACLSEEGYSKPVIAPLSLDFEIQQLPRDGAGSGVRNLSYVAMPSTLRHELETFQQLIPFKHVALIANREVLDSMPQIEPNTIRQLEGLQLKANYIAADRTAASVLEALPRDIEVAYVWPLLLAQGEMEKLIEGFNARRIASFSWLGKEMVDLGMYATLSPDAGRRRLARRIALNVQQILLGTAPEELEIDFTNDERLIINIETARKIVAWPRYERLLEAELVGDYGAASLQELSLFSTVHRAVEANRSLAAERAAVAAGAQSPRVAKAAFLPSIEAGLTASQIDEDRAAAAFGTAPEKTTRASISATQLIYSDGANAQLSIERALQRSREAAFEQARLDIALDASSAYLDVLRAENQFNVRNANLELTRRNLELAQSRRRIGTATQSEIYRWENQIANDRRSLVEADASRRSTQVVLNQLLHEPLDREFRTVDIRLNNPDLSPGSGLLDGFIETPLHFKVLTEFVVTEGLDRSVELQALDESIAARRRALLAARRAYWAPTVAAQASVDERLSESGAGQPTPGPGLPDESEWSVGIAASLKLFAGGERKALRLQADAQLQELERRRELTTEIVERNIRTSLIAARASYTSIALANDAASAARENLRLVQDSYARGAVKIIDLIDAQNSTLASELAATDAVYKFFDDLMRVQRSSNRFDFFTSQSERESWASRLQSYFLERNIKPWGTR
jgi:outer membrane protein TolC/ABC-type uncharacterized transport system substrate-binding protein